MIRPPERRRRAVIVTGSSSGIGRAIALRLARDGDALVVADKQRHPIQGGEPTDETIEDAGGECVFVKTDVASRDACTRLIAAAVERYGAVDVLVNNARVASPYSKPLLETSELDWDEMMAVNLRGPFILCRAAIHQMLTQPRHGDARGRIINITSVHGMIGVPCHFTYAVSKGGLVQMTRQIALEHGRDGIICNAVAPGKIQTGSPDDVGESELLADHVRGRTPFPRLESRAMSPRPWRSSPQTPVASSAARTWSWTAAFSPPERRSSPIRTGHGHRRCGSAATQSM